MNIRPLGTRIVVKRQEAETETASGLIIPDDAQEQSTFGEVLAVGKGEVLKSGEVRPLDVVAGDIIIFGKYGGQEVELDGEKVIILQEADVLGVQCDPTKE